MECANKKLVDWGNDTVALCKPERIHWCDGSSGEFEEMYSLLAESGCLVRLNDKLRPNSYLCRTSPADADGKSAPLSILNAEDQAGEKRQNKLFDGCMRGRRMYVVPYASEHSHTGVVITDSPYLVVCLSMSARVGEPVLEALNHRDDFIRFLHSVGAPLEPGQEDSSWPCNPENRELTCLPGRKLVYSYGSAMQENALPVHPGLALKILSAFPEYKGDFSDSMTVIGINSLNSNETKYLALRLPAKNANSRIAMTRSALPGWEITCISTNAIRIQGGEGNRLFAVNPVPAFAGRVAGMSESTDYNAMTTLRKNTIFTNTALTRDGDIWWEGFDEEVPEAILDWKGNEIPEGSESPASHPEAGFLTTLEQCPVLDPKANSPKGVPLSAVVFADDSSASAPLVMQADRPLQACLFFAASLGNAPSADKLNSWLKLSESGLAEMPKVFCLNSSLFSESGNPSDLFPALKWIVDRLDGRCEAVETPAGLLPKPEDIDLSVLKGETSNPESLLTFNPDNQKEVITRLRDTFAKLEPELSKEIIGELDRQEAALQT